MLYTYEARRSLHLFVVVFDSVIPRVVDRMGETQRPINLTQWRGINYGATTSTEDSRFTGDEKSSCEKCTPSCSSSCASHCLREDGEYWYEAKTCFPCVLDPKNYFIRKVPFIKWLRRYSPSKFLSDVIAGMTVGLMVVPQALAYAKIAGLPLEVKHLDPLAFACICASTHCSLAHDHMHARTTLQQTHACMLRPGCTRANSLISRSGITCLLS